MRVLYINNTKAPEEMAQQKFKEWCMYSKPRGDEQWDTERKNIGRYKKQSELGCRANSATAMPGRRLHNTDVEQLQCDTTQFCAEILLREHIRDCHGFVILLLVFHIITSWTKEKNYVSQRTSRSEKEDTSRKIRHLVAYGLFHFRLLPGRGVGVLPSCVPSSSRAFRFGNSLTLSHFICFIILTFN